MPVIVLYFYILLLLTLFVLYCFLFSDLEKTNTNDFKRILKDKGAENEASKQTTYKD